MLHPLIRPWSDHRITFDEHCRPWSTSLQFSPASDYFILYIKLNVFCLYLIQIHISEPISTKLCTHLPLGLEETVGYVWSENVWYFPPFWPFSSGASAESSARNGCRRRSSSTALYPRFLLLLVWRHGNYEADDSFAFCKTHPRQRYICDSCWC